MTQRSNLVHPTPIADLVPKRPALVHGVVVRFGGVYDRPIRDKIVPVRSVLLRDATGEITLALWGAEVSHVREADRLLLVEAWVNEYLGHPELSLGSRGYIVNLGPASGRGPVWHPDPRGSLFVWGLVRRRLREKDLRRREGQDRPAANPPLVPTPSSHTSQEVAHAA
jgi:hypothetical protein